MGYSWLNWCGALRANTVRFHMLMQPSCGGVRAEHFHVTP